MNLLFFEMGIRHEKLWQPLEEYLTIYPKTKILLYFKTSEGDYKGLPLVFRDGEPRLQTEAGITAAMALSEPAKTEFMKRYRQDKLFSLASVCKYYFGPLYRGNRETHVYDPMHELQVSKDEILDIFPDLSEKASYGNYIRLEKLSSLVTRVELQRQTDSVEEKEATYTKPVQLFPLNQILYGPPGTGKTYQTINYAVAIIESKPIEAIQAEDRAEVQKRYEYYQEQEQIEFITFHQSYSYEEFVQGLRPDTHRHTDNLHFRLTDGVFKRIADRAKANYEAYRRTINKPKLPFESLLDQMLMESMNRETEEVEIPLQNPGGQFRSMIIYEVGDTYLLYKRRATRGDNVKEEVRQLYLHKLRESFYGKEIREAINRPYYEAVVYALRKFEKNLKHAKSEDRLKNYVLIIDEINRANISRVFGELITLLEEDKRLGKEHPLTVTLPSGESFAVPCNLSIVGTMNTADKSISLLDAALRRRFVFVPMYPQYDLIPEAASVLQSLNEQIRERKGVDFMIGHSFFINKSVSEFPEIFNQKIIPLLYEYFNTRIEPIRDILQKSGIVLTEENYQLKVTGIVG
ncbi:AAA family ATPase [Xanthocytophaga flava]|uniref:AAA family ATPase n=1 Tax=Xanthocytophaga flava TaxID=3048013 RepID=UPI0028D2445C|nr:AAA family ATPase [Xanthocytophaga flavus]MDJ1468059.1 AAA family ATPase [Xanthocytophaga flavus]